MPLDITVQLQPCGALVRGVDLTRPLSDRPRYAATGGYQGQRQLLHRITVGERVAS